jgi:hypothetical protein
MKEYIVKKITSISTYHKPSPLHILIKNIHISILHQMRLRGKHMIKTPLKSINKQSPIFRVMLKVSLVFLKKWCDFWNHHLTCDWSLLNFNQIVILKVISFLKEHKIDTWWISIITHFSSIQSASTQSLPMYRLRVLLQERRVGIKIL